MCELYKKTIELLGNSNIPVSSIAESTGVGLRWLYDLKAGRFSDPGVNKIQRIHDFLNASSHDLEVKGTSAHSPKCGASTAPLST